RACRGGGGSPQGFGVQALARAAGGEDQARRAQPAVEVHERGAAEVAVDVAAVDEACDAAVERPVEVRCGTAERTVGHGDGEEVGLDRLRASVLDVDPHRGAMLTNVRQLWLNLRRL